MHREAGRPTCALDEQRQLVGHQDDVVAPLELRRDDEGLRLLRVDLLRQRQLEEGPERLRDRRALQRREHISQVALEAQLARLNDLRGVPIEQVAPQWKVVWQRGDMHDELRVQVAKLAEAAVRLEGLALVRRDDDVRRVLPAVRGALTALLVDAHAEAARGRRPAVERAVGVADAGRRRGPRVHRGWRAAARRRARRPSQPRLRC